MDEKWIDEKQVSVITGRALPSLRNDRWLGRGLNFYKLGKKSIRYKHSEVLQYMESFRVEVRPAGGAK